MTNQANISGGSDSHIIHQLQHAARQYKIITSNEDIITRTGEQIVRACQLEMNVSAWNQNFKLMADHLEQWCKDRSDKVALALIELRNDKTVFYVIPVQDHYDFILGSDQSELDIYINTRGGIGYAETRQIPLWEIDRFVSKSAYRIFPRVGADAGE